MLGFAVIGLFQATSLTAQPSGGPYGPIQQHYDLPEAGTIYYVAPDGVDKATGKTLAAPTTLATAIARVVTGDAIVMRGGVYRTGGLKLNQGVTIQPYADERPVVKGTRVATDWEAAGEGVWRTAWTRLFPAAPADWWRRHERNLSRSPLHMFNNDMVFADGQLLGAVGSANDLDTASHYIDYANGYVYIGTDPAEKLIEITAHNSALQRTIRDVHGKTNDRVGPTLRGITFTQYARLALEIEGTEPGAYMSPDNFGKEVIGTTFEHLTISHCSRVAGYFRGDGLTIRHCLVSDCGTEGIYVINSADVLLERNIVTRTNSAENLVGYFATAVKIFNQSYNVTCRDNLIIDNPHASGIWYDVGNVDGVFVNNWIETTQNGFFFEISKGAICAGNVFVNCPTGLRVLNSSGVRVYQNTFYNSEAAFQRSARSHTAGDHFGWHASAGPDVAERHSHAFVNNLLVSDASFERPLLNFWQQDSVNDLLTAPQVDAMDGNVYVRPARTETPPLINWSPTVGESHRTELSAPSELHALQPNFEAHAHSWSDYHGPLFRSAELKNFELDAAFVGATSGVSLPPDVRKQLGWPDGVTFPGAFAPARFE